MKSIVLIRSKNNNGSYAVSGNGSAVNGGLDDLDHDGMANLYEYIYKRPLNFSGVWNKGLNLSDPDYDDDGLIDGYSFLVVDDNSTANNSILADLFGQPTALYHTNATFGGVTNVTFFGEGYYGTHPKKADTDDDGLLDQVEWLIRSTDRWVRLELNATRTRRGLDTGR